MSEAEVQRHAQAEGFNRTMERYRARALSDFVVGRRCLDVGCGDGGLLSKLALRFELVLGVDLDEDRIAAARARAIPNAAFYHDDLQDIGKACKSAFFDTILCVNVLEHVKDPVATLRQLSVVLAPHGRILAIVPNARSVHRRVGMAMGLLRDLSELSDHDRAVGHRRYYDPQTLIWSAEDAGLRVGHLAGVLFKPLPNVLMESLSTDVLEGFYLHGARCNPADCAELLVVLVRP